MTDSAGANLDWLGDDTIAAGRDIMHFDIGRDHDLGSDHEGLLGRVNTIGLGSG